MILVSYCSCLWPIHWSQVLSREWRCSWSCADRRCSNYIWVISNFIAYSGAAYIRGLAVLLLAVSFLICRLVCYCPHSWVIVHKYHNEQHQLFHMISPVPAKQRWKIYLNLTNAKKDTLLCFKLLIYLDLKTGLPNLCYNEIDSWGKLIALMQSNHLLWRFQSTCVAKNASRWVPSITQDANSRSVPNSSDNIGYFELYILHIQK